MALVHVIDLGFTVEGVEQSDAAEAKDGLLTEAVVVCRRRRDCR